MAEFFNVLDRRLETHRWRTVEVRALELEDLKPDLIGKSVLYTDVGVVEIGTVSSYRGENVWSLYSSGDTGAGAHYKKLWMVT